MVFTSILGIPTPVLALARNDTHFFDTLKRCASAHLFIIDEIIFGRYNKGNGEKLPPNRRKDVAYEA